MDEALLAAYRATDYRVRPARGGVAVIRIGEALPMQLQMLAQDRPWGFITAWNPRSAMLPRAQNRLAQRALLALVQTSAETAAVRPGVGVAGNRQWREPSLWVVGLGTATLDALGSRFGQWAYVHGQGRSFAQLRLVPAAQALTRYV